VYKSIILASLAGAVVGAAAGWQPAAEATDCGCWGDTMHLELVSGPDVPCDDGEDDCASEWMPAPVLQKDENGVSGDLLQSGHAYLDKHAGGA